MGRRDTKNTPEDDLIGDLVVALLSVNGWGLEKTFALYDDLQVQGLFAVESVAAMPRGEVCDRLEKAGYRRGDFLVGLLAGRLHDLARILSGEGKKTLRQLVEERDLQGIDNFLLEINGVGPQVVHNFKLLRKLPD